jgi:hypothetical protein
MTSPRVVRAASSFLLLAAPVVVGACSSRTPAATVPGPAGAAVTLPVDSAFARAVQGGTRTSTGQPGPRYWQQYARYDLRAQLDPERARLSGESTIRYLNRSPDTLRSIPVHLYQNLHAQGAPNNTPVPTTGGITLTRVMAQGQALAALAEGDSGVGYRVKHTVSWLYLPRPVAPGDSVEMQFAWSFRVPPEGTPRMGQDGEVYLVAYWYPQVAVYDDVGGWHADPYLGNAEFYMGYADYDVAITLPERWLVDATGDLVNSQEVLSDQTLARLADARKSASITHVATSEDRTAGRATRAGTNGQLTWRYQARSVRDFTFTASLRHVWDAGVVEVGDANGDGRADTSLVSAYYRPERTRWVEAARYGQHALGFLSRLLWPYPYPRMVVVEGLIGGGMEFPMMTLIGGPVDTLGLYTLTAHEIGHMWYPMHVGTDEKRYPWMDEGLTNYNEALAAQDFFKGYDEEVLYFRNYAAWARTGREVELMRHGDQFPEGSPAYQIAAYDKPSVVLRALRGVLGDSVFLRAYREFGTRWQEKHPKPQDFFNTFERVSGRDLDWFWRPWFYETAAVDLALDAVRTEGDSLEIVVENRGQVAMPATIAITRADSSVQRVTVPVTAWLSGAQRYTVRVAARPEARAVQIDPERYVPDIDPTNQRWGEAARPREAPRR